MNKYTFVVVAHQTDYDALCVQARSMALYLSPNLVEQIIIIENPKLDNHSHLLDQYGGLIDRVTIMAGSEIAALEQTGWFAQQILKLLICDHITTTRYVTLDAKNILVYPLRRKFLETWVRPRSFRIDYTHHSSLRWLRNTLAYFGLPEHHAKSFMPTTTPFTLVTKRVRELIALVEERDQTSFAEAFMSHQLTEYFLYAGFLIWSNRLSYDFKQPECKTVWDVLHSDAYVREIIEETETNNLPFFSVHRRAIPMLSEEAKQMIVDFYQRHQVDASGLIGAREESRTPTPCGTGS